jgi:hypothetical protein
MPETWSTRTVVEIALACLVEAAVWAVIQDLPMGVRLLTVGLGAAAFLALHFGGQSERYWRGLYGLAAILTICVLGIIIYAATSPQKISTASSLSPTAKMTPPADTHALAEYHLKYAPRDLTLYDLFESDFSGSQKIGGNWQASQPDGLEISITQWVVIDLERNTKVLEFYIPYWDDTVGVCVAIANKYQNALKQADEMGFMTQKGASALHSSKDAVFSGMIFIYHEKELTPEEIGQLTSLFKQRGVEVDFRSGSYLSIRKLEAMETPAP